MERRISIRSGTLAMSADLDDSPTADALLAILPFSAEAMTWGDEIRPAGAVNVPGRLPGDLRALETVRQGDLLELDVAR